jgi:pimeloyl-ACP methyl ester carboxylesterase
MLQSPAWFNRSALAILRARGFELRQFEHRGTPVYYLEGGKPDAPRVAIFPGYGDTVYSWTGWLLWLSRKFRVLALDFPGSMGLSPAPAAGTPLFDDQERAAEEFLVSHSGKLDFLVSNSLGGWISLRLAARHGDRMGHLVAVNPGGAFTTEDDIRYAGSLYKITSYADYLRLMKHLWHKVPPLIYPAGLLGIYQFARRPEFQLLPAGINRSHFVNELLPSINVPISVVWGVNDTLFPEAMGKLIVELAPNATYHPIEKAGHMPHLERPVEFWRVLEKIIQASIR